MSVHTTYCLQFLIEEVKQLLRKITHPRSIQVVLQFSSGVEKRSQEPKKMPWTRYKLKFAEVH